MNISTDIQAARRRDNADAGYPWMRDGSVPHTREDLIAEIVALVALLFSVGIGLLIAVLPVSAKAAASEQAVAPAAAASAPSLELAAFRIVAAAAGKPEHLESAAQAHAGDELEYQAVYRNPTRAVLHHVMVTVPVPAGGVEYVLESAAPRADLASTDGKTWSPLPLMRAQATADGRNVMKPAPGADYRFLRWDLGDVPAGTTRTVRTRVHVLSTASATTVASR